MAENFVAEQGQFPCGLLSQGLQCPRAFNTQASRNVHRSRAHTREERGCAYRCNYCAHGSATEYVFRRHSQRAHPLLFTPPRLLEGLVFQFRPGSVVGIGIDAENNLEIDGTGISPGFFWEMPPPCQ
uniref:C2H2-type domain-containing protein n=1 Tax=Globodera rostochiensis TaxID=31243 RepID=A0A914IG15_GLORO